MAYRLVRVIGPMEMLTERFAEGLGPVTATASMQLVLSMRCVQESLYLFDIFGEHSLAYIGALVDYFGDCFAASLSSSTSPFLAFQHQGWWQSTCASGQVRICLITR